MKHGGMERVFQGKSQGAALTRNFIRATRPKVILWHGSPNAWAEEFFHKDTSLLKYTALYKFKTSLNYSTMYLL